MAQLLIKNKHQSFSMTKKFVSRDAEQHIFLLNSKKELTIAKIKSIHKYFLLIKINKRLIEMKEKHCIINNTTKYIDT